MKPVFPRAPLHMIESTPVSIASVTPIPLRQRGHLSRACPMFPIGFLNFISSTGNVGFITERLEPHLSLLGSRNEPRGFPLILPYEI